MKVLVYGSLKRGFSNHRLLATSTLLGEEIITGFDMYDLGSYPAIQDSTNGNIILTELYEVDESTFSRLDTLEGYPRFYNRKQVDTSQGKAWIYFLEGDLSRYEMVDGLWEQPRYGH